MARNSRSKPKDRDNNSDNDQNSCRLSSEVGQNESLCKNLKGNNPVNGSSSDKGSNLMSEDPCSKETASCQILEESSPYKRKAEDTEGEKSKKQKISSGEPPFERAIFIDSTWKQTKGIIADDRLKGIIFYRVYKYVTIYKYPTYFLKERCMLILLLNICMGIWIFLVYLHLNSLRYNWKIGQICICHLYIVFIYSSCPTT